MSDERIPVYLMPGMAAAPTIFDGIELDPERFDPIRLSWTLPGPDEDLVDYARRRARELPPGGKVLLGVSLGGLLVQEMARFTKTDALVVVSSVKSREELPAKMHFARVTGVHRLLPTAWVENVELLAKYAFGDSVARRLELYEKYLDIRDKRYIDWCIDQLVNWPRTAAEVLPGTVHLHGESDAVFPLTHIKGCTVVPGGTHTMIIHRARWFNEHLPTIILEQMGSRSNLL